MSSVTNKNKTSKPAADVLRDADPDPRGVDQFDRDDRIAGVLTGAAVGDALGAGYEGSQGPPLGQAKMIGGGFGSYQPGQWTDDTECAVMLAEARAEPLEVAAGLLKWYASNPPDIGPTSSRVLGQAKSPADVARLAREVARGRVPGEVSNGSLMRTSPVALVHLGDREKIADAARQVSDLTHCDEFAGDACVLWCLAIDRAVELGEKFRPVMVTDGLEFIPAERQETWAHLITDVLGSKSGREGGRGLRLRHNWSAVGAFRAALYAVVHGKGYTGIIQLAIALGGDTDTVAAIAGALAGGWHGVLAIPTADYRRVHGWPNLTGRDLARLALVTAGRARVAPVSTEWAGADASYHPCTTPGVRHWGPRGAAGMVPVAEVGGEQFVLLAHRSKHVQTGDCWSTPGGALEPDETPLEAAFRECREEVQGLPPDGQVVAELIAPCPHECGWSYQTFAVEFDLTELPKVKVRPGPDSWETDSVGWVPVAEVGTLNLHPGFRASWPGLREKLAGGAS